MYLGEGAVVNGVFCAGLTTNASSSWLSQGINPERGLSFKYYYPLVVDLLSSLLIVDWLQLK